MTKYDAYPAYKDSGGEWLGEIPKGWGTDRTRNHFSFRKGLTITKENLQVEGIPTINYGEIHSKFGFRVDPAKHSLKCVSLDYRSSDPKALLEKHDFIFADTSEDLDGSGNFSRYDSNEEAFAGYHTVIARLNSDHLAEFLAYLFDSTSFRNQVRRNMKGVKVYSITQGMLKALGLVFPSPAEQTAIATFLDDKAAKIDKAIAQKEQLIALLKERKQIIIQNAVTKGLDPKAKMKDSGIEWIGEIPEHWEVASNATLFRETKLPGRDGLPVLSVSIHTGVSDDELSGEENRHGAIKIADRTSYKLVEEGDITFNMMRAWQGGLGRVSRLGLVSPAYVVAKPNGKIDTRFFELQSRTSLFIAEIDRASKGITDFRKRLYWDEFKSLVSVLPPLTEQKEIGAKIDKLEDKTLRAITAVQLQIQTLREYKATLIDSAVTGKIKIS